MKTFFIADTHFGHKNIIKYENRPFETIEQMDKAIISNWNNTVSKDDRIFMLGDFSFYNKNHTSEILRNLNGIKYLILGNHDRNSPAVYRDMGFDESSRFPIIFEDFYILSHEPIYLNENMPYANIFGHVHASPLYKTVSKNSFCVSVERINYTPIDFEEIKKQIAELNK